MAEAAPDFSGTAGYESKVIAVDVASKKWYLDIGEAYEACELFVNGASAGKKICAPYCWDISELLAEGENRIRIEVATTLFYALRDPMSMMGSIDPSGIFGPVQLLSAER